ncbi:GNAT family N-acetyltransferase [Chryseobacterium culicis]|uniref:N-acetyltransferase domain-containing protein n=1 Tax=Chryseobacterium culicis TaxID=680127 RepID=A0A2S9D198_CHRCI|nr:GNAT family N-acetyltransferase [Chryseobacterium culicis]PRB86539.1 hypothetical protein CQ022_09895 [Chryseobacterium culicis]PRB92292.1 hypothetical protein CQ033_03565 [Chryseobacterium culicis]
MQKLLSVLAVIRSFRIVRNLVYKKNDKKDIVNIINLHNRKFGQIDNLTKLYLYTHKNRSLYTIIKDDVCIAYALYIARDNNEIHLKGIAVEDNYLGKGFAKKILSDSISELGNFFKIISLNVVSDNTGAISLYKSFGFVIESENEDEISMIFKK